MSTQLHLCEWRLDAPTSPVDAAADFSINVAAACPHGCDLSGLSVSLLDERGVEIASGTLAIDGDEFVAALLLKAPVAPGQHRLLVALTAADPGQVHMAEPFPLTVAVRAHAVTVNAWALPSAIAAGERFRFKVGARCSCGCSLAGRAIAAVDDKGAEIARAPLNDAVWPGTQALYFADLEAEAPPTPGTLHWHVETAAFDAGLPHTAGHAGLTLTIVEAPDFEVTVEALDSDKRTPIKGMHVLMHPYRAFTDDAGIARLKVARGRYNLVVSGFKYVPHISTIDADADVTTRAELAWEPEGDEYFRQ